MKLLVRNLSRSTTENAIQELFATFGEVTSCDLVLDKETGASKGFAFVELPNEADAKAALTKLHMSTLDDSTIRVKTANS